MTAPAGSATAPASPETVEWFAGLFEPLAGLAIERGVKLPALIDSLKLALVRAATSVVAAEAAVPDVAAGPGAGGQGVGAAQPARSDSRLAVMTGVHRKDLRRIRTTGSTARPKGRSIAGEVFARWQSDPRFLTTRGRPRVLPRQTEDPTHPSFEELVTGITRDVHPRPVLDELVRLRMVETVGSGEARVRLLQSAFVPVADSAQMLQLAHDNLADHCAAVAANLSGDGRRFLEQATLQRRTDGRVRPRVQSRHAGRMGKRICDPDAAPARAVRSRSRGCAAARSPGPARHVRPGRTDARQSMKRPLRPARRSMLWLAMVLAACSDPGSGGTGVPGDASSVAAPTPTPPPAGAPSTPQPPPSSPPPGSPPAVGSPAACSAPANASGAPYAGIIEAQADGCLLVGDRSIVIAGAQIVRRSGAAAVVAELVPGVHVTIEPEPTDPGRARTVTIDDIGI